MLGLDLIAAHVVGDLALQTDRQAALKFTNSLVRAQHVTVYTACFVPVLWANAVPLLPSLGFLWMVYLLHFLTDCKRWGTGSSWVVKPVLVDQALHLIQLAVLCHIFLGR